MPAAQQGDQRQADLMVLADDDALDVGEDLVPVSWIFDMSLFMGRVRGTPPGSGREGTTEPLGTGGGVRA